MLDFSIFKTKGTHDARAFIDFIYSIHFRSVPIVSFTPFLALNTVYRQSSLPIQNTIKEFADLAKTERFGFVSIVNLDSRFSLQEQQMDMYTFDGLILIAP